MDENLFCPNGHAVSLTDRACPVCHTLLPGRPIDLPSQPLLPSIPGYDIVEVLGSGGMGIVYKARQRKVHNRLVSLKMIRALQLLDAEEQARLLDRFRREAAAVADLNHPHIVQVYDVGEHQGHPYLALEYVEGCSLDQKLAGHPQAAVDAAALAETLARTIHCAHQKGIVHRDLKPANVLMANGEGEPTPEDTEGARSPLLASVPKISDFGLVKRLGEQGATETGEVLGSAPYMAPEQFRGRPEDIGPPVDVYALGVILYEMLTGRPPFLGKNAVEIGEQVLTQEPVPPRRLVGSGIPIDLDSICLKCLEKEPIQRYPSAEALADDLRRFQNHEPTIVRPLGLLGRAARFAKRRTAAAGVIALSILAPLVLLVVVLVYNRSLSQALGVAEERKNQADQNARTAERNADEAKKNARESQRRLARQFLGNAARALDGNDLFGAFLWGAEARSLEADDASADALHRLRLAAILRQCPKLTQLWHHDDEVLHAAFSPDGTRVVTAGKDHMARVWDVATGAEVTRQPLRHSGPVLHAAFSPDGKRIVTASRDGTARVWDATSGEPITGPLRYVGGYLTYAAFSPDGKRVVTAGGPDWQHPWVRSAVPAAPPGPNDDASAVRVWDAVTGKPLTAPIAHGGFVHHAAFSSDGKRIVTAGGDGNVHVLDAATGKLLVPLLKHEHPVYYAVFAPDGDVLTAGGDSHTGWAQLWGPDVPALPFRGIGCEEQQEPEGMRWKPNCVLKHDALVFRAVFSPDGKLVLTASADRTARLWNAASGSLVLPPLPHRDMVKDIAFSPDGLRLATASGDPEQGAGVARVWDAVSGQALTPPLGHGAARHAYFVHRVGFSPDGRRLLTAADDRTARVWDLASGPPHVFSVGTRGSGPGARDGTPATGNRAVRDPFDPAGHRARDLPADPNLRQVQLSPDGQRVLAVALDGAAQVWDTATGAPLTPPLRLSGKIRHVAFSPDGKRVVAGGEGQLSALRADGKLDLVPLLRGEARVWDAATGRPLGGLLKHDQPIHYATFSPNGGHLATVCVQNDWDLLIKVKLWELSDVHVWDVKEGRPRGRALRHEGKVHHAAFSPDGKRLVTAGSDQTARVWVVDTGTEGARGVVNHGKLVAQVKHKGPVFFTAFSPDGTRLVTAGGDETAEVWDAASGQPVTPPLRHQFAVTFAAFSADGQRVVTTSRDDTARVWDAGSGAPVTPPLRHSGPVHHAAFSADGRLLATAAAFQPAGGAAKGGAELLTERRHNGVRTVAFVLPAHEGDGEARVWDATTGEPITPALPQRFPVRQVVFVAPTVASQLMGGPGPPALLAAAQAANGAGEVRRWDLSADDRPAGDLQRLGQVLACRRLDPSRELTAIEAAELQTEWRALRAARPADFTASKHEVLAWHRSLADACEQDERWKEAVKHLDALIAADPGQWYLYFRRADMHERLDRWKETVADCSEAIKRKDDHGPSWSLRGYAHGRLNRWQEAIADYSRAVQIDREDWNTWHLRAFAYGTLGRWREALEDLDRAARALQGSPKRSAFSFREITIWSDRALLRLHLGDAAGYRADCAALLKQFGSTSDLEAARLVVWAHTLAPGAAADFKPLVELAEKGAKSFPDNNCPMHHTLGAILYRAGQLDAAAASLQRAMKNHGKSDEVPGEVGSPRDWFFLAMIHHRQGRTAEARLWLDRATRALAPTVRLSWKDRLEFQLLHREAEALLSGK